MFITNSLYDPSVVWSMDWAYILMRTLAYFYGISCKGFGHLLMFWKFVINLKIFFTNHKFSLYRDDGFGVFEKYIKVYKEYELSLMVAIWKLSFTNRSENQTTIRTDLVLIEIIHLKYWSNFNSLLGSDYRKIVITIIIIIIIISSLFNVDIS